MAKKVKDRLIYRGKPLLRCDDTLYYGDFAENFITVFKVLEKKKVKELDTASKVSIELLEKRGDSIKTAHLMKKAERNGLYSAMDIGCFWLEDILEMEREFKEKQAQA